eukprot:TRINITY_DN1591_c0_g1_i2.p1 TRINITY_DN1591_c0_g1~~TRINITY_DN1591_c0_g1_i2.p1  ORF type:complete len:583 (-),score=38.25 TRINITY_DN1591_c0_g1_i2:201-1949(-)
MNLFITDDLMFSLASSSAAGTLQSLTASGLSPSSCPAILRLPRLEKLHLQRIYELAEVATGVAKHPRIEDLKLFSINWFSAPDVFSCLLAPQALPRLRRLEMSHYNEERVPLILPMLNRRSESSAPIVNIIWGGNWLSPYTGTSATKFKLTESTVVEMSRLYPALETLDLIDSTLVPHLDAFQHLQTLRIFVTVFPHIQSFPRSFRELSICCTSTVSPPQSHVDQLCDAICTHQPGLKLLHLLAPPKSFSKRHALKFLSSLQKLEVFSLRNLESREEVPTGNTVFIVHPTLAQFPVIEIQGLAIVPRWLPRLQTIGLPCPFHLFAPNLVGLRFIMRGGGNEIDSVKSCLRQPIQSVSLYEVYGEFNATLIPNLMLMSFLKSLVFRGRSQILASQCAALFSHLPLLATFQANVDIDSDDLRSSSLWLNHRMLTDLQLNFISSSHQPSSIQLTPEHLPSLVYCDVVSDGDLHQLHVQSLPQLRKVAVALRKKMNFGTSLTVQNCPLLRVVSLSRLALGEVLLASLPTLRKLELKDCLIDTSTEALQIQLPLLENLQVELDLRSDKEHFHRIIGSLIKTKTNVSI